MTLHRSILAEEVAAWTVAACALVLLAWWYWREFKALRARARLLRRWRARMESMAAAPFHLRLLTPGERARLIGHGGIDSGQWMRSVAAEFIAGRRDSAPTCGEYLEAFGRHPRVRPGTRQGPARKRGPGLSSPAVDGLRGVSGGERLAGGGRRIRGHHRTNGTMGPSVAGRTDNS